MFTTTAEAAAYVRDQGVEFVDIRFVDLPGVWQHFTIPAAQLTEEACAEGMMFDGSSIRGFQAIHESDMKLMLDPETAFIDPFRRRRTLVFNSFIVDPYTNEQYSRDPRTIARKAEAHLRATTVADKVFFGAEAEFYLFDSIRYHSAPEHSYYMIDSVEGAWNTGRKEEGGNLGYKTQMKAGYFPVSPNDRFADLRDDMATLLTDVGLDVERAHHEVGTGGQQEINYRFNTLLRAADDLMKFKYVIKNAAFEAGKTVTFMPKPLWGDNGSGMHCHQSLWAGSKPLMYDERGYGGLSDLARWYIGGLLAHAPSLLAFTNPSVNSYRRLVPGFEAPVNLVYSARNRSAAIRIPVTGTSAAAKRVEYRVPDPSANPYLAFSAQLLAGLDGVRNRLEPALPIDKDIYELPPEEYVDIAQLPNSLDAALEHLESDHDYLLAGDVFTSDLIDTWVAYKREHEILPVRLQPSPKEFELYYDL